ncbi:MAG: nucleotidyltransferase domain-containing protein, partial [Bdellovibrionota bacterium]
GNRVYYKANLSAPGLAELQSLFIKTIGLTDILRNSLKSYLQRAEVIFIYGSLARAEEVATSDVDLMIIGDIKLSEIAGVLRKSEKTLGRDVNATVYTTKEFAQKLKQGDSFIRTVLREEKIFLKGSLVELEALDRTRTSSRS